MNNVKNSIGWADYTWNPVTGCKRGCSYCYARRIYERFNKTPFSDVVFHPARLLEPAKTKKPSTVFVGSMSDIEYWNPLWLLKTLIICAQNPQHTFMFLSKNPKSYNGFFWPANSMQGLTLTCEQDIKNLVKLTFSMSRQPRAFLSIEPILGTLKGKNVLHIFEKVIVGAMTGPGATIPKPEWIQSVIDNVPKEKIFWKNNIRKYLPA